ncbi:hypothetical protein PP175_29595 (plasmid) [Aneurinibacillus sp. Ricciae_BoGa-3]|uniref:hypothetical protein n=1 Tax=Aneurinibacillus sp. Ricciae_BoGa-3 TaxID=3022697 RepID=UPI002342783E|nr:hypothetical protein [Aneurinibacillus sp. Ricciae_BoGa-3]WCK57347.1 hypothetical protein PP175_29595 [Aneurinibacillus sp. Ricciae_BoGa-3]
MDDKGITIYYTVKSNEGYELSAKSLYTMVAEMQRFHPGKQRHLYIDIEGHRNRNNGLDTEMFAFLTHFVLGVLGDYVTSIKTPLYRFNNPIPQNNQLPVPLFGLNIFHKEELIDTIDFRASVGSLNQHFI